MACREAPAPPQELGRAPDRHVPRVRGEGRRGIRPIPIGRGLRVLAQALPTLKLANLPEILTYLDRDPNSLSIRNRKRDERYLMLVQLKHFDPRLWESYVGLLRSFVLWITPIRIVAIAGRIRRWVLRRLDAHSPR